MHEWALAEAILITAQRIAKDEELTTISEVIIRVGQLQQVEIPILRFALKQMSEGAFKDTKYYIRKAKSTLKCRVCGNAWQYNPNKLDKATAEAIHFIPEVAHTYIKCANCGSPDFEIVRGRGVWLEGLKGVKTV